MADQRDEKAGIVGVFDRAAPAYGQGEGDLFGQVAADLVYAARLTAGQRVLDVGCGRGANLFLAADAVGPTGRVTGIDLAPTMVSETAAEISRRGLTHVEVRLGDAEAPDVPAGTLDAVLAGLVIFFLPDPGAAVRAYRRLLRPGGRLALSTFPEERKTDVNIRDVLGRALTPFLPARSDPPAPSDAAPTGGPNGDDRSGPESRTRTRKSLTELLRAGGFTEVRFVERKYRLWFADGEHYWHWLWSHGARAAVEQVPAGQLDEARDAVAAVATELLEPADGGGLNLHIRVRLTTAVAA